MGLKASSNQKYYDSDQSKKKIPEISFCVSRSAKYPTRGYFTSSWFALKCVDEESRQNHAEGDTAQTTNFAQTNVGFKVWNIKVKKWVKIFYSMQARKTPRKNDQLAIIYAY